MLPWRRSAICGTRAGSNRGEQAVAWGVLPPCGADNVGCADCRFQFAADIVDLPAVHYRLRSRSCQPFVAGDGRKPFFCRRVVGEHPAVEPVPVYGVVQIFCFPGQLVSSADGIEEDVFVDSACADDKQVSVFSAFYCCRSAARQGQCLAVGRLRSRQGLPKTRRYVIPQSVAVYGTVFSIL